MTSTSSINHKDSYFEHPVLTKIRGEPTYETQHHLKNKLKANESSVPRKLGGSNNGYLGMILMPAEYHRITQTSVSPTVSHSPIMPNALPNTADIAHYVHLDALPHCSHIVHTTSGPTVQVANGNVINPNLRSHL